MQYLLAIPTVLIVGGLYYYLIKKPERLILSYLVALPVLPPLPIGTIEISALDILTIPTILYLIRALSQKGLKINGYFTTGFFLFLAAAVISFISFTLQQMSFSLILLFKLIRLTEMFLPVLLAALIIDRLKKDRIILMFLIGGGLAALIGIVMYIAGISLRQSQTFMSLGELIFRAAGTHGDSGSFGNLMGLVPLVGFWLLIYIGDIKWPGLKSYHALVAIIAALLSVAGLALALSRGGIVLLAVGIAILLAPLTRRPGKLLKVILVACIVIFLTVGVLWHFVENDLVTRAVEVFGERLASFSEITTDFDSVTSQRTYFWHKSWNLWSGNVMAWPFGLGYKSLDAFYNSLPDNNFFQALFEMGILGAVALLSLIIMGLKAGLRRYRQNQPEGILVLAVWLGILSNMLSADVMTYWHNITPVFILLATLSRDYNQSDRVSP